MTSQKFTIDHKNLFQIQQLQCQLIQAQASNVLPGASIGSSDPILLETIDKLQHENNKLQEYLQESVDHNIILSEKAIMVSEENILNDQ